MRTARYKTALGNSKVMSCSIEQTTNCKRKHSENNHGILKQCENQHKRIKTEHKCQMQKNKNINHELFENYEKAMSSLIESFHNSIKSGPEYICTCCDQLCFQFSVKKCTPHFCELCPQSIRNMCITGVKSVGNNEWICSTCEQSLKQRRLPACAKANFMTFPTKPDFLNLTQLEERLISPRTPFMQIRELPRGGQLSIHGNVVNDDNSTVHLLPRLVSESKTIPVKLKRCLEYKHHYQFQSIRPKRVLQAVQYLVQTSKLFQDEGIQINTGWLDNLNQIEDDYWAEFHVGHEASEHENPPIDKMEHKTSDCDQGKIDITPRVCNKIDDEWCDKIDDEWCEVEERMSSWTARYIIARSRYRPKN